MAKNMKRIHKVTVKRMHDEECGTICETHIDFRDENCDACAREWKEQTGQMLGIRAEAEITIPASMDSIIQHITSGGLWGIESDSDAAYLKQIEDEQLEELRGQLHAIGFSQRAITAAFRSMER